MAKPQSRSKRWQQTVEEARTILSEIEDARNRLMEKIGELRSIQEEFESWKDNLPENLASSPLGEKLESICEIDLEPDEDDFNALTTALDEAEATELPLGFGRD